MDDESRSRFSAKRSASGASDGDLLERFALGRDESAFAELVRRHGPAVWTVCRRMLRQTQDTEDAFQATFLILVRCADKVRKRASVRSWLQGVAKRVAVNARRTQTRRSRFLERLVAMEESRPPVPARDPEIWSLVVAELNELPEQQRLVLQRFLLEGQSYEKVAEQLGLPIATVASHIRRGRQTLRARLAARGLAFAGAASAVALASAHPPSGVLAATVKGASALVTGQTSLLRVQIVSLMKKAMTSMVTLRKLLVLLTVGLSTVGPAGVWFARQPGQLGSRGDGVAQADPSVEPSAPRLNVSLPPGTQGGAEGPSLLGSARCRGGSRSSVVRRPPKNAYCCPSGGWWSRRSPGSDDHAA